MPKPMSIEDYLEACERFKRMTRHVARGRTIVELPVVRRGDVETMDVVMSAPGFRTVRMTIQAPAHEETHA